MFAPRGGSEGTDVVAGCAVDAGGREARVGGVACVFEVGVVGFAEEVRGELGYARGGAGGG